MGKERVRKGGDYAKRGAGMEKKSIGKVPEEKIWGRKG